MQVVEAQPERTFCTVTLSGDVLLLAADITLDEARTALTTLGRAYAAIQREHANCAPPVEAEASHDGD